MSMKNQRGFSMLEVLISMLVIMIGVLGIAGMQMLAVNNTENARYEGQAAILASSLAAEMQANPGYWTTVATAGVTGTTVTGGATVATCNGATCSPAELAYYDLYNLGAAMSGAATLAASGVAAGATYNGTALPNGAAAISCTAATVTTPTICTIKLTWNETNTAISNKTGTESGVLATGTVQQHDYQTLVSIQP